MPQKQRIAKFEPYESMSSKDGKDYFRLTASMVKSKAWQALDAYDITAYVYFKSKYTRKKNGDFNHDDISLTYKEMEPVMSWGRFKKSVDNLLRVGLIDIVRHSPHTKTATVYGLSTRWHKYGEPDFKEAKRVTFTRRKDEQ